ncbi:hypothetical protein [Corallococcus sp. AS-1-6]|uniref:hypothetical protein n=1 Tax=Corallococcus sp. AS-1-6 TaxID=2874599 RepID=UPI001CC0A5B5|nr:hypothetical protein [Corallococcus sp. AS-1-6]MBZ4377084.1 hypothetical protein [Corallococcus sp. AS-1-6]
MLRTVLVASTLFLGSFIPQVASACTITCSGGSCTGSYSCECQTNGTPKCKDSSGGGGCLVQEPACFESATMNSQEFIRRVESQLGDQLAVSELRRGRVNWSGNASGGATSSLR